MHDVPHGAQWVDWNNTELFVRVTDGANLQSVLSFAIEVPPDEPVDVDSSDNENSVSKGSGGVNTLLAFIVAIAIVILTVFTAMLAIRLRARDINEEETEYASEDSND